MVSFVDVIIENYPSLKLDEVNVIILIHLFKQKKQGGNFLSTRTLAKKMNISADECSKRVVDLVQGGFIEFEFSSKSGKETFNLNPTIQKLENLFESEVTHIKKQEVNEEVKTVVKLVEEEYHRPLTTYELDIINVWILEEKYNVEDIKSALLESLKAKKTNLRYVDIILINRQRTKTIVKSQAKDEELEMIINQVYAKKK